MQLGQPQPERKFGWTCDRSCNVQDVVWLTEVVFHSSVGWREVGLISTTLRLRMKSAAYVKFEVIMQTVRYQHEHTAA